MSLVSQHPSCICHIPDELWGRHLRDVSLWLWDKMGTRASRRGGWSGDNGGGQHGTQQLRAPFSMETYLQVSIPHVLFITSLSQGTVPSGILAVSQFQQPIDTFYCITTGLFSIEYWTIAILFLPSRTRLPKNFFDSTFFDINRQ